MTFIRVRAFTALFLCTALTLVGFELLKGPMRSLEIAAVLAILHAGWRLSEIGGYAIQALPAHQFPFRVEVTPYCSSLVAILALAGIAAFVLPGPRARRLGAFTAAALMVLACNIARIAASIWVGVRFGAGDLVLFHNWVGTLFALAYTLLGFIFMLFLMLPKTQERADIPRGS
jgi:carbamoyl-phosphate synthase large subunit